MEAFVESLLKFTDGYAQGSAAFKTTAAGVALGVLMVILYLIKRRVDQRRHRELYKNIKSIHQSQPIEEIKKELFKEFEAFKNSSRRGNKPE